MNATTTATENPTATEDSTALPKFADFPDPRPAYRKPILKSKISVDAILQRWGLTNAQLVAAAPALRKRKTS